MHTKLLLCLTCLLASAAPLTAQLVSYTFGSAAAPTVTATTVTTNLSASEFSGSIGSPSTGSSSPLSSGAYFAASTWAGPLGSNYFEFMLTPAASHGFSVTTVSFDYRATSTGPTELALRSSADGYAASLFTLAATIDGAWHFSGSQTVSLTSLGSPITFRLYGYGASANGGTLRTDNVILHGAVFAMPEPASYATLAGFAALGMVAVRRTARRA